MNNSRIPSNPCMEMVVSHLREQIVALHHVLEAIERNHNYQEEYIDQSIKSVEIQLHRLRKLINL